MKYEEWKRNLRIENEFRKSIEYIADLFLKICRSSINQFDYMRRMENFQNTEGYNNYITSIVRNMVTPLSVSNYSTWRKAARTATKSRLIYNSLLREIQEGIQQDIERQIEENARLIRTLPTDTANKVVNDISRLAFEGMRASEIAKEISKYTDKHARASARLIARTEVSKTSTMLTKARAENLNLNWYVWRTAQDGKRVRPQHRIMEGVLVNWNNPPSPEQLDGLPSVGNYHAGCIWNCRCYAEVLLEIDDVRWPHKVHVGNSIKTMSRAEFEKLL